MVYQYKREPLTQDEANRLANACKSHEERLVIWVLLDTGMRVSELVSLDRDNIDWQQHRLMIYGKGGPRGKKSKRRVIPLSERARTDLGPAGANEQKYMILIQEQGKFDRIFLI